MKNKEALARLKVVLADVLHEDNMVDEHTIWYNDQKYYLDRTDGSYERSAHLFLHHVMFHEGVYALFLGEKELKLIESMLAEDGVYRTSKSDLMDLLDDLYAEGLERVKVFLGAS